MRQKENSHRAANSGRSPATSGTPTKTRTPTSKRGAPARGTPVRNAATRPSTPTNGRSSSGPVNSPQPLASSTQQRIDPEQLQALTAVKEVKKVEPRRAYSSTTSIQESMQAMRAAHQQKASGPGAGRLYSEKEVEVLAARLHQVEVDLVNTQEDCIQYRTEYDKIKEEGCALYDAYMVKCNTVKDLQQRLDTSNKERDLAQLETSKVRIQLEEQVLLVSEWQLKCASQAEKFKESFRQYKTLKEENGRLKTELQEKEEQLRGVKASRDSLSLDMSATDGLDESSIADYKQMEVEFQSKEEALLKEIDSLRATVDKQRALIEEFEFQADGGQEKLEEATTKANKLNKAVKKKRKIIKKYQSDFKALTEDLVAAQRIALAYSPSLSPINTDASLDLSIENCSFGSASSKDEITMCEERAARGGSPRPSRRRRRSSVQTPSSIDLDSSLDEDDSSVLNDSGSWIAEDMDRSADDLAADNSDIGSAFNFDASPCPSGSTMAAPSPLSSGWVEERSELLQQLEQAQDSIDSLSQEREELLQENEQLRAVKEEEEEPTEGQFAGLGKMELVSMLEQEQQRLRSLERDMILVCKKHKGDIEQMGQADGEYRQRYESIVQQHRQVLEHGKSVAELHAEIASFQGRVQELCALLEENTDTLLQKEASIRALQAQVADSNAISARVAELEEALAETELQRDDLQLELDTLKSEKGKFMQDLQQLNSNLSDTSSAKTELGQLCADLQSANAALEAKLAEQDARSRRTTEQLEEETKALQHYSEKYLALSDRYDALLGSVRRRDEECSALRCQNADLTSEAERCAAEAQKLQEQVKQLTAICGEHEGQIAALSSEKAQRHSALEEATASLSRQESDVKNMRSEVKVTRQEKERLVDELSRQQEVNDFLNTERELQNQHIEELEQEFEEVQHKLAMLEVQQTHSQDSASKHQRHVLDKVREAEARCEQLSEELTASKQKAAATARAQEQQLQAMKQQLSSSTAELEAATERTASLESASTAAAEAQAVYEEQLQKLSLSKAELEQRCEQLQNALLQREEANASLTATLTTLQQRKSDLKEKLHRAMRQGSELQAEYDKLVETQEVDAQHVATLEANYQQALQRVDSIRIQANEELIEMAKAVADMEQEVENHLIELKIAHSEKEELALQLEMLYIVCEEQDILSSDSAGIIKRNNELEQQASALSVRLMAEDKRSELARQQVDGISAKLSVSDAKVSELQQALEHAQAEALLLDDVLSSVKDVIQEHKQELMATGASDLCALVDQLTA